MCLMLSMMGLMLSMMDDIKPNWLLEDIRLTHLLRASTQELCH